MEPFCGVAEQYEHADARPWRFAVGPLQAGKGSATLSMAYAAAAFADSCLKAMAGQPGIEECAYVQVGLRFPEMASKSLQLDRVCTLSPSLLLFVPVSCVVSKGMPCTALSACSPQACVARHSCCGCCVAHSAKPCSVQSHVHPRLPFFASRLRLGRDGVEEVLPLGQLNAYEEEGLKVCVTMRGHLVKGTYVARWSATPIVCW